MGYQAEKTVEGYHVDIAICSCKGFDAETGVTDSNDRDSQIKKAFFASAKKKILAVDSSKFDRTSFVKICDIKDVDVIATNEDPGENWRNIIEQQGVELVVPE